MSAGKPLDQQGSAPGPSLLHAARTLLPAWAPKLAVVLLIGLVITIGTARLQGYSPTVPPGQVLLERTLAFADTGDGGVRITDLSTGQTLDTLYGEQGFVRGVLRGLARERRLQSVAVEAPYVLSLRDDGRLLISDPSTGQRIDLASFGHDNAASFTRWLPPPDSRTPTPNPVARP